MQIILLGGPARVGKTETAKLMSKWLYNHKYHPVIVPFAAALKNIVEKELGFPKDKFPEQYRAKCQEIGAAKRAENPAFWVNLWQEKIIELRAKEDAELEENGEDYSEIVVITDDVRYLNEVNCGRYNNGISIFVDPGARVLEGMDAEYRKHESEALSTAVLCNAKDTQDIFDYRLRNDSTLADWEAKLNANMQIILDEAEERRSGEMLCECGLCKKRRYDSLGEIAKIANKIQKGS